MSSIDLCLNCTKTKCSGTCQPIREAEHEEERRRKLTVNGETHTLAEWEKITGLSYKLLDLRLRRGKRGHEVIKPKRKWKRRANNG